MASLTARQLKFAILEILASTRRGHRFNMLGGKSSDRGDLERHLDLDFDQANRRMADGAFDQLLDAGMIQSTYDDLIDPKNWIAISEAGRTALARRQLDDLDVALSKIGPQLVEMREGAWAALASGHTDSARQAAHSARELIDQVLKEGAPDAAVRTAKWFKPDPSSKSGFTRRHRLKYLMVSHVGETSNADLREAEAACHLVFASDDRLMALSHARGTVSDLDDVRGTIRVAETALRRILVPRGDKVGKINVPTSHREPERH